MNEDRLIKELNKLSRSDLKSLWNKLIYPIEADCNKCGKKAELKFYGKIVIKENPITKFEISIVNVPAYYCGRHVSKTEEIEKDHRDCSRYAVQNKISLLNYKEWLQMNR